MRANAGTRLFAVLGDPVRHSLSPRFQNAAFRAAGIDATYVALATTAADVEPLMRTLAANGGGGNVTIPFKSIAAAVTANASARVRTLGAANLFGSDASGLCLGNTDVDGILAALDAIGGAAGPWCIVGTGGSARAAAGAAMERGVSIAVKSRDPARATAFGEWATARGLALADPDACRVVINATPQGLQDDDPMPLDPARLDGCEAVLDLTYRAEGTTAWVRACRAHGLNAADGREVLVHQGAASWALWFPEQRPPLDVMRAALDGRTR
ncbi:MAG: hypothetical protein ABJC19_00560 [Gemmatimonadota bacterium]